MQKIKTIIRKEWAEVFKRRMVLFTVIFLPLFLTALPLIILYATRSTGSGAMDTEMPAQFTQFCDEDLSGAQCFQVYLTSQFMIMFMLIPLIIPVNIAAYAIVGEKTTRSLEPLLATPITTTELLVGKNLAAAIPAILATWVGFIIYAIGVALIVRDANVISALINPLWLIAVFLVGPLLAILSVNFSLMVSSRVNDPRVAEQVSTVIILPVLALFFGQISGLLLINNMIVIGMALLLVLVDIVMVYFSVKLFQRETILTRWK
jgi:ABC-2 type transport system permease protein